MKATYKKLPNNERDRAPIGHLIITLSFQYHELVTSNRANQRSPFGNLKQLNYCQGFLIVFHKLMVKPYC